MTDTTNPPEPVCKFDQGCHRVAACEPGCAAVPVPASAPTDRAAIRDRIAEALRPGSRDRSGQYPEGLLREVDAVLAVLPAPTDRAACPDPIECSHEAALGEARETNRRLNYRAQELESELAAYRRAVAQWEVSDHSTYVPLRTLNMIAKAAGRDIEKPRWLLHYQRVEQAEAVIERVRRLHDRLATETELASPDDRITRADAAERIATALDAVPVSGPGGAGGDEGDELTCVDMCGSCDACGMEPFGTPAEGWRQAARFLRRTARDSGNRAGSLHAASLIETELRARAEAAGPDGAADEAQPEPESGCAHCGGPHAWDDCETYTALVASEQQPEPRADTALRIRVLSEILGRLTGRQDGDSATDDVPAATVRRVLAEILVGMQRGIGRGGDTEQPAAVAQPDGEA